MLQSSYHITYSTSNRLQTHTKRPNIYHFTADTNLFNCRSFTTAAVAAAIKSQFSHSLALTLSFPGAHCRIIFNRWPSQLHR